jgi:hypothetical protein
MTHVPIPYTGPLSGSRRHGGYPLDDSGASGATLTWACSSPDHAAALVAVFEGDFAASPRAARRYVPWSARARAIRADVTAQPSLPGMGVAERRRVTSYGERTAARRASVAGRVGVWA